MITFERFEQRMLAIFKQENVCIDCLPITVFEDEKRPYHEHVKVRGASEFEVQEVVDSIRDLGLNPDDLCGEESGTPFYKGLNDRYHFSCCGYPELVKKVKELYDTRRTQA